MCDIAEDYDLVIFMGKYYLDTSALVKLVLFPDIKETGSDVLYKFRKNNAGFYTLDLCIGEALNVFKQKAFSKGERKQINFPDGYLIVINRLLTQLKPRHTLKLIETDLSKYPINTQTNDLIKEYRIDFIDAIIIEEALLSRNCLLITADKQMEEAAKAYKLKVWNCVTSEAPI